MTIEEKNPAKELDDAERRRLIAESWDKAQMDFNTGMNRAYKEGWKKGWKDTWSKVWTALWTEGWEEGWKEGWKKGREEKCMKVARIALCEKLSIEMIARLTGLSIAEIDKSRSAFEELSADGTTRPVAESGEEAWMNFNGWISDADEAIETRKKGRREGREEGRKEGEERKRMEVARNALCEKLPIEMIAKLTGLSAAEIERLAAES